MGTSSAVLHGSVLRALGRLSELKVVRSMRDADTVMVTLLNRFL